MLRDEPTLNGDISPEEHCVTVAILGAGQRGRVYAEYALVNPSKMKVVAVADPRPHRLGVMGREHQVPDDLRFTDWELFIQKGRVADAVAICVMDGLHAQVVAACSRLGYHILCEKPMATSVADCVQMVQDVKAQESSGMIFGIGHVLRYSPYNTAVKHTIASGALGEIINIQHIEPVGHHHFSHSYVRGNWRKESEASFSLMAKCCHDIDILSYYLSGLPPAKVHSFGSIGHFKPDKQPKEAQGAKRCLDCPMERDCVWSAKRIYVDRLSEAKDGDRWAKHLVDADVLDIENVTEALRTGPYGRCVYHCDNDVVDHQVVNIEYEGGVTASMTMSAFTEAECDRSTLIQGTKGELRGDMKTFTVFDFLTRKTTHHTPQSDGGMHGGGDTGLSRAFIEAVATKDQTRLGVTPDEVLDSHLLVFAAEKARREERVVRFQDLRRDALAGKVVF